MAAPSPSAPSTSFRVCRARANGAGWSAGDHTLAHVSRLKRERGSDTMAHPTCVGTPRAQIREIFRSSKFGNIAGCMVQNGSIRRNAKARLLRDGVVIADTSIASLRREKDDATEVREGFECGMTLSNYNDIRIGVIVETYEMVEKVRS